MKPLSVLIPTTPRRMKTSLPIVVDMLNEQADGTDVEVIALLDNEKISIGEKVNLMVSIARGKFVSVVADDDTVHPEYISTLLSTIDEYPDVDVITFDCAYYIKGIDGEWEFTATIMEGKDFGDHQEDLMMWRNPSDKMCWNREFRMKHPCKHTWETSDTDFARRANKDIGEWHKISKSLYNFYYDPAKTDGKRYREKLDRSEGRMRSL